MIKIVQIKDFLKNPAGQFLNIDMSVIICFFAAGLMICSVFIENSANVKTDIFRLGCGIGMIGITSFLEKGD